MIRVLVAEDSPTVRALLVHVLRADPELEIVGTAENGAEAVEMTKALRPDVVTMDIHMPVLDGLDATKLIMVEAPTPIVIVSSTIAVKQIEGSLHALRAGALAALPKPGGPGSPGFVTAAAELVATVKAMSQVKVVRRWPEIAPPQRLPAPPPAVSAAAAPRPVSAVAIAASTGGPGALHRILGDLPGDFPAPILVVQHISPSFVAGVADWLNACTSLEVKLARDAEPLAPHTVYFAPDGYHLGVRAPRNAHLSEAPPIRGFRPSASFLFESCARVLGPAAVGVILTGMGSDGLEGLRALHAAGGRILAQDEATSVVWGMPAAAVRAGVAHAVLPVYEVAPSLMQILSGRARV